MVILLYSIGIIQPAVDHNHFTNLLPQSASSRRQGVTSIMERIPSSATSLCAWCISSRCVTPPPMVLYLESGTRLSKPRIFTFRILPSLLERINTLYPKSFLTWHHKASRASHARESLFKTAFATTSNLSAINMTQTVIREVCNSLFSKFARLYWASFLGSCRYLDVQPVSTSSLRIKPTYKLCLALARFLALGLYLLVADQPLWNYKTTRYSS